MSVLPFMMGNLLGGYLQMADFLQGLKEGIEAGTK
jgi:hypothetical protein